MWAHNNNYIYIGIWRSIVVIHNIYYIGKRDPFRRNGHRNQSLGKLDRSVNARARTIQVNIFDHIFYYTVVLFFHPLRCGAAASKDETERKTRKITEIINLFFFFFRASSCICLKNRFGFRTTWS